MTPARGLRILLAVALLAAWTNALVHPLAHLDHEGALVHLDGGHDEEGAASVHCDAIAAVAAVIGQDAALPRLAVPAAEPVLASEAASSPSSLRLAYRSQAPPRVS